MPNGGPHLILTAAWVDVDTPQAATDAVVEALKGTVIPGSGAAVSFTDETVRSPEFRRDMARLLVQEAVDFLERDGG